MKYGLKRFAMVAVVALHSPVHAADERFDVLKKANVEGCVAVIDIDKTAPKDRKLAKPYCTCVYDTYFDKFTQAEKNHMFLGTPAPPNMEQALKVRLQAAQAACRKKVGS